mmetsp:Transcript_74090/g.191105  ORF Transcript_74090/g.191105 Transcript_74090/m.191105 type:complete len:463 (-) Transcript_74090:115-1503(-)
MFGAKVLCSLTLLASCAAVPVNSPAAPPVEAALAKPQAEVVASSAAARSHFQVAPAQTVTISVALTPSVAAQATPAATPVATVVAPAVTAAAPAATAAAATAAAPAATTAAVPAVTAAAPAAPAATAAAPAAIASATNAPAADNSLGNNANAPTHSSGILPTSMRPGLLRQQFSQLLAGLSFAVLVKALCMASNVLVQVSPYPQVKRWESRQCTGEADAAPFVSIAFGGWQWCFYGTFAWLLTGRSGFLILVHSNCLGAVLGTYYIYAFYRNCRDEASVSSLMKYLSAVSALCMLQVCALLMLPLGRALFLSGLVSSFCSFVGAISMLVTVPIVLRTQDSRSIPGPLVIANLGSAMVWVLCGWMLADPLVMGPNIVSVMSSAICLRLKYLYPSDTGKDDENEDDTTDLKFASLGMSKKMRAATEATPLVTGATNVKQAAFNARLEAAPLTTGGQSDGTGGTF